MDLCDHDASVSVPGNVSEHGFEHGWQRKGAFLIIYQ
jgi:hypothetical protein